MSDDLPVENFGYTHLKTPKGLTFTVWKDHNADNDHGVYLALLTPRRKTKAHIVYQLTIDINEQRIQLEIQSPEEKITKLFNTLESALDFADTFARDQRLTNFDPKKRKRETI